jgi:hypothetical protein
MTGLSRRTRVAAWVGAGVLGGLAAGIAIAQLGVAGAADPTPTPSASPGTPGGPPGFRDGPFHDMGPLMGFGMGGRLLHGEATVKTPGGDLKELATQYGRITAVDGATLTVRSSDDFTRDFVVDENTRIALNGEDGALSSLKTGDMVRVIAVKDGSAWHAESVMDGRPPHPALGMLGRFGEGPMHPRFERHWRGPMHMPTPRSTTQG